MNRARKPAGLRDRAAGSILAAACCLAAMLGLWPRAIAPACADSAFSIAGLGEWVVPADARGRGLGGAGIGIAQKRNLSLLNPAVIGYVEQPTLYLSAGSEKTRADDAEHEFRSETPEFPLLRGVILLPGAVRASAALHQWSRTRFDMLGNGPPDTLFGSVRRVEGGGGFTALSVAAAVKPWPWLSLGLESEWPFGSYHETWRRDFPDSLPMLDALDERKGRLEPSPTLRAGVLATYGRVSAGAFIRPARELTLEEELETVMGYSEKVHRDVRLPLETGLGLSVQPRLGLTIAADVATTPWSEFEIDGERIPGFRDVTRIGAGVEWVRDTSPRGRFLDRVPLRLGYHRQPLPYRDAAGDDIDERFVSLGFGLPFTRDNGMIDAAVEYGRRGDLDSNGLEETVLRFTIGVTYSRVDPKEFPQ